MSTTNYVTKIENGANYSLIPFPNIIINLKLKNIKYPYIRSSIN